MPPINGHPMGNGASRPRWWRGWLTRANGSAPPDDGAYRRLALQLHYEQADAHGARSVLVVGADPSAQPADAAVELAEALADQLQRRVLLIDACPADPVLSRALGCSKRPGFQELVTGTASSIAALSLATTHPNVAFVPAGVEVPALQPELGERAASFLAAAAQAYEFTVVCGGIVSSPSSGPALALASSVGRTLLIVAENATRTEDLDAAQDTLRICKARNAGLLLGAATDA